MPNIRSAKKRVLVTETKTMQNKIFKTSYKTACKKFESAVEAGNKDEANALYVATIKKVDTAVTKGIIHKNTAARKKSRYTKMLAAM